MLIPMRHVALRGRPIISHGRHLSATTQRIVVSNATKHREPAQDEGDRACGVPPNSTETGPHKPGDILPAEFWIMVRAFILGGTAFWFFMPSSPSKSGQAIQKRNRAGRLAQERKEGYEGEEETTEMKELEAGLIKDAVEKTKKTGKA
ncbi:hypothetical protein MMC18_002883 [Xylographa bjoerkii]|nr:hypothetical protein [Xylographa bjoerkii]